MRMRLSDRSRGPEMLGAGWDWETPFVKGKVGSQGWKTRFGQSVDGLDGVEIVGDASCPITQPSCCLQETSPGQRGKGHEEHQTRAGRQICGSIPSPSLLCVLHKIASPL